MDDHPDGPYLADKLKNPDNAVGTQSLRKHAEDIHGAHDLYDAWIKNHQFSYPVDHKREAAAAALLQRGHATFDDILRVSYGEWPVKGLDILGYNPRPIKLGDAIKKRTMSSSAGPLTNRAYEQVQNYMAVCHGRTYEGSLDFNLFLLSTMPSLIRSGGMLQTAMMHEGTHTIQHAHGHRLIHAFGSSSQAVFKTGLPSNCDEIILPYFRDQSDDEKLNQIDPNGYITTGREIQARLAQVLPDGYQTWQTMPVTREQLLVALHDIGLNIPDEVMATFKDSPTLADTKKTFSSGPRTNPFVIHQLNQALAILTPEGQVDFCRYGIPGLYIDLIEMYGDTQGRARFGMGNNPRLALRQHQMAMMNMVAHAGWQEGVSEDGARIKTIDYTQLSDAEQMAFTEALRVTDIYVLTPENQWPPPGFFDESDTTEPDTLWTVVGSELDKLEELQRLLKEPVAENSARKMMSQSPLLT